MINWNVLKDTNFSQDVIELVNTGIINNPMKTTLHIMEKAANGDIQSLEFIYNIAKNTCISNQDVLRLELSAASLGYIDSIIRILNLFSENPESYYPILQKLNSRLHLRVQQNNTVSIHPFISFVLAWNTAFGIGCEYDLSNALELCDNKNNSSSYFKTYSNYCIRILNTFLKLDLNNENGTEEYNDKYCEFTNIAVEIKGTDFLKKKHKIYLLAFHEILMKLIARDTNLDSNLELIYSNFKYSLSKFFGIELFHNPRTIMSRPRDNDFILVMLKAFEASKYLRQKHKIELLPISETIPSTRKSILDICGYRVTKKGNLKKIEHY